jgi:ABC-type branched-subunit amino acid transport system substrate-binding protein
MHIISFITRLKYCVICLALVAMAIQSDAQEEGRKRGTYKIALLVPLYLEQVADTMWKDNLDAARINELQPFRFIQFYQGFMLAADSLCKQGLEADIFVYDVDQQASKLNAVLEKPEMKKMDLIVGPLFKNSFSTAAEFARNNKIPIVNALSLRPDILDGNPFVFKMLPSVESQPAIVGELVHRDYSDHKVLLYVSNSMQNTQQVTMIKEAIERGDPAGRQKVSIIDYKADSTAGFRKYASLSQPNLVIIYSESEVLPAVLLSKLAEIKDDYRITVIGLPEWEKLTNIESIYLNALNTNIFMASYTDLNSENVKGMIKSYRSFYFDEPLTYALSGFDAGYYFLYALMKYGDDFRKHLDDIRLPLTLNQYHFGQKGDGGYDNLNWNVIQYMDYYLLKKSFY